MSPDKKKERRHANLGASVRARLLNIARESKRDYNRVLIQYAQERLLYRISISRYRNNFILKGALLFFTYKMPDLRLTKDIDLLGSGVNNDVGEVKSHIEEVAAIAVEDGVTFDPSTIAVERIAEQAAYGGLRVSIRCSVGGARNVLRVDIGFGDKITAGPVDVEYPVMLGFPAPYIRVYSLESAIAEKFEAIVRLNILTSRMKDFYDLIYLAHNRTFTADILAEAIKVTFATRGTPLDDRRTIFDDPFRNDEAKAAQWVAFHITHGLTPLGPFNEAIALIEQFLEPILVNPTSYLSWQPDQYRWQRRSSA
jgi:predicted nucleotidyltransferase component of viral defense system